MPLKYRGACPHPGTMSEAEHAAFAAATKEDAARYMKQIKERSTPKPKKRVEPSTGDPLDPAIERWLRSIEPRQELTVRYAMRARFPTVRASRKFTARIDEVRAALNPNEDQLAMIIADARLVEESLDELLDGNSKRR